MEDCIAPLFVGVRSTSVPARFFHTHTLRIQMARITVEDCQRRVDNRFLLVQMAIKRVRQFREGYEPLVDSKNKEVVTALREIAAGKVLPEDKRFYTPVEGETTPDLDD